MTAMKLLRATALSVALTFMVIAAGLVGCGVTTSSFSCQNADCEINLSGSGADAELDTQGITVVLAETGDGTATLDVIGQAGGPDETVELAVGDSAEVLDLTLTLERVEGREVTLSTSPS